jgi:hypothetical protein
MRKGECGEINHDADRYKEPLAKFLKTLFNDEGYKRIYGNDVSLTDLASTDAESLRAGDFEVEKIDFKNDNFSPSFFCRINGAHIALRGEAAKKVVEFFEQE